MSETPKAGQSNPKTMKSLLSKAKETPSKEAAEQEDALKHQDDSELSKILQKTTLKGKSPHGSIPKSISKSIPKSIPRRASQQFKSSVKNSFKVATPSSVFIQARSYQTSGDETDDEVGLRREEVEEIVAEHLVESDNEFRGASFGSASHALVGGAITRDIYKWKENRDNQPSRPRSNSHPEIHTLLASPSFQTAAMLREPGGFRRHFISNKAKKEGKKAPNFLTSNFIDFLVLYGFYGGDVYPSDDEDEEYDPLPTSRIPRGPDDIEQADESAPLLPRPVPVEVKGTSESKAFFMLVKAFVGTGVLFLPKAFSNGGLVFSLVALFFIGWLTKHCMILLVETSRAYGHKSFGDLGQLIYGDKCRHAILASIAISQMGFCCAYYIFVGQNLRDLLMIVSDCKVILPDWFFICIQVLVYIPLAWVRKIKNFGITSLIADVFILAGLGYIFVYDLVLIGESGVQNVPWMNMDSFPLFVGTAMFAFEGICLILPIAESMEEPAKFEKVVDNGMIFIGFVFISIGALGYMALGDAVETIVFLNLPKTPAVTGLQFFYAISIMLSFPLCVYPAIRITEQALFGLSTGKASFMIKWEKNLYRAALTSLLGFIAWAGSSNLDKVVSLVGCFACIPLSFIYPALFHSHITTNKWVKLKDWIIVFFGTLAMLYTTWVTIQQWYLSGAEPPLDRCKSGLY